MQREFIELDFDEVILKDPMREDLGDLTMITASISKMGLLTPIIVDRDNVLITGARRLEACRRAGVRQLPAIRLETTHDSMVALDIQVDLNLCRQPLTNSEVETLIGKKRLAASRAGGAAGGVLARIKQLFGSD